MVQCSGHSQSHLGSVGLLLRLRPAEPLVDHHLLVTEVIVDVTTGDLHHSTENQYLLKHN